MDNNSVYKKLVKFRPINISFAQFQQMLYQSSKSNPIRIGWTTMEGDNDYYWCFWDSSAYTGDKASKTKEAEGMVNLQVMGLEGDWRTIDYSTVYRCNFNNQAYSVE